jgi:2-desacetyl-2-hydroxyethyl bacteriochlorophyllide A dehydrogenase
MGMRALTVVPGVAGSVQLSDLAEPDERDGPVLVSTIAIGICGTDDEILSGAYGRAPQGEERLVLGHESLGRVVQAPEDGDLSPGDLVVGIVRRPDPVPCINCAAGEWDMCRNGRYTEHGIKGLHGFARDRYRAYPDSLVKLDPALGQLGVLLEPTSVVAKAWEHIERIGRRAVWEPRRVLITGAGPVGLLAALLAVQRGLEVHVLDRIAEGRKPELVQRLGAQYHSTPVADLRLEADVVIECTGVASVIAEVLDGTGRNGIVCLAGVSSPGRLIALDIGQLNRELVLENDVVFGSVNANRRHYQAAAEALAAADASWLSGLVTRQMPIESYVQALEQPPDHVEDIKTVVTF